MISDALNTVLKTIDAVAAITGRTGTSVNGVYPDPTAISMAFPCAWALYAGKVPVEKIVGGVVPRSASVKSMFIVMVYLDNTTGQADLEATQLPILEAITAAMRGIDSPIGTTGNFRFAFEGERLQSITPARLAYEQRYSLISVL